jgi:hypothetical protein
MHFDSRYGSGTRSSIETGEIRLSIVTLLIDLMIRMYTQAIAILPF